MAILSPVPEPVPLEEVAAVLAAAASRVRGGSPALIDVNSRLLAAALEAAGFRVVRNAEPTRQLTL